MGEAAAAAAEAGAVIRRRLEERREEVEAAVRNRVYAIADPIEAADPAYPDGLRLAVAAAVGYGLLAIERGEEHAPPPPPTLLIQARLAARSGVEIETVLRRYFAGYALLGDYLLEEAENAGLRGAALKRLLRIQSTLFDRLLAAVSEEYRRESEWGPRDADRRRAERIERLLSGELLDTSGFAYELEGHHIGLIAIGPSAAKQVRDLAAALDRGHLIARPDDSTVWAWLGGRRPLGVDALRQGAEQRLQEDVTLAIGECGEGIEGWRLTHRQARAALPVALRGEGAIVRYADVALLASLLRDELLATSLRQLLLAPLERERDHGAVARETLRAYFAADRNVSSAAAALGVRRHTVTRRLRAIEESLGRPLGSCAAELSAALSLEELGEAAAAGAVA